MTPKKKSDKQNDVTEAKKHPAKSSDEKETGTAKAPAEKAGPKRMVLKTLKRASVAPPSPTLHRVTGVMTRRVVPKAPPPKPAPPPPPPPEVPAPPKPVEKKVPALETKATAPVPASASPVAQPAPVVKETKKPAKQKKSRARASQRRPTRCRLRRP